MIAHGGHHMVSRPHESEDRRVDRVSTAVGEDHPHEVINTDKLRNASARTSDEAIDIDRFTIAAPAIGSTAFAHVVVDGIVNCRWLWPTRSGVVEVNPCRCFHETFGTMNLCE